MEILEKLRQWLLTYPGWGDGGLTVEHTDGRPGSAGLFLAGLEELQHQPDLQGNTLVCNRLQLVLERNETAAGEEAAGWLLDMTRWLRQQCANGQLPPLGCYPDAQRLAVKQGSLRRVYGQTTAVYQLRLQLDYWEYWEVTSDDGVI